LWHWAGICAPDFYGQCIYSIKYVSWDTKKKPKLINFCSAENQLTQIILELMGLKFYKTFNTISNMFNNNIYGLFACLSWHVSISYGHNMHSTLSCLMNWKMISKVIHGNQDFWQWNHSSIRRQYLNWLRWVMSRTPGNYDQSGWDNHTNECQRLMAHVDWISIFMVEVILSTFHSYLIALELMTDRYSVWIHAMYWKSVLTECNGRTT
jgi:hypothetical protein